MKVHRDQMEDRINQNGVRIQSQDWGELNISNIHFPAGANASPLLEGLPNNLCPVPHWGMVLKGSINVDYADGTRETVNAEEVYYWPPGHTVSVDQDYQAIEFSPRQEMCDLIEHLKARMAG